jgi:hypothetical protein
MDVGVLRSTHAGCYKAPVRRAKPPSVRAWSAALSLQRSDLAIKCATHGGSDVGGKIRGQGVTRTDTYGISRFSRARFPAIPNPPMCRRVYDEVCNGLGHRHHLGERSPRACLYRPASHGGLKVRRQHKSRDAVASATVVDLSHEVQPAAVGQRDVDECSVQLS